MELSKDKCFLLTACAFQGVCLIFLAVHFDTSHVHKSPAETSNSSPSRFHDVYAMYMDVHVMIFVGFGFLMTYLRKYSLSAVSLNFVVAALSLQWGIVCVRMAHQIGDNDGFPRLTIDVPTLVNADFAAGAVLISFGAVLGKTTPTQLLGMSFVEVVVYAINEYILSELLEVIDAGGSMVIHTFGAFFGLAVTMQLGVPSVAQQTHNKSRYSSDIFAMVGTLFLWMYWPSFNAALVPDGFRQERAVVNTLLSIGASCAATFAASAVLSHEKKLDMVHIQNATLAGGVAMGATCELAINPASAVTIGVVAGALSVVDYRFLLPALETKIGLSDTAGILNLHGMPGVLGGLACGFATMAIPDEYYGSDLEEIYRARSHRTAAEQGGYQILATAVTVGIAVISGAIVGQFLRSPLFHQQQAMYQDDEWFHVPEKPTAAKGAADLADEKSIHGGSRAPCEPTTSYIAIQTE